MEVGPDTEFGKNRYSLNGYPATYQTLFFKPATFTILIQAASERH